MNEYRNFRGRGRGNFHFRGSNSNMFNNNARSRGTNNFSPLLPAPNFRDNKLRWQRPHMNTYSWRPPNVNAPSFHPNTRFPPPLRHQMPPRPIMSKPPVISRPVSPLPGSEEARQKAIAEASARIKEQLNLNEGASTSMSHEKMVSLSAENKQLRHFLSSPPPTPHEENIHKNPEKITRKKIRRSTNSLQSVDVEELRKKILTQFTYMSKGRIQNLVNNPGSTRYDAALQHLVRDMRLHLSSELRTMYNNRENDYSKESNEMIDHFNSIVPDLGVELVSLPDTMVAELSKILQFDINNDVEAAERRNSSGSDCTLVEPEQMFKQAEELLSASDFITMNTFECDIQTPMSSHHQQADKTIENSTNVTQEAAETLTENDFFNINSGDTRQSASIFTDYIQTPATSDIDIHESETTLSNNDLTESVSLIKQVQTKFRRSLTDRKLDKNDQQTAAKLENDFLTMISFNDQLETNDYIVGESVCEEGRAWDISCEELSSDLEQIRDSKNVHTLKPIPIDETDYTVDNIVCNMDDTNGNMDVNNSNLDSPDLIVNNSELTMNTTNLNIDNVNLNADNIGMNINNTDLINTNVIINNANSNKNNITTNISNIMLHTTKNAKINIVKKKVNKINIKLNLNKINFNRDNRNMTKDTTNLSTENTNLITDNIDCIVDNCNPRVTDINLNSDDTDPFLTKNPLFNPPPSTPQFRSFSPDERFCNPPFEPTMLDSSRHESNIIHDSPVLRSRKSSKLDKVQSKPDFDLLDRIANISATLNKDDMNTELNTSQHSQINTNTTSNTTLFDFDSVWISKKTLPARQTSSNSSSVNNNVEDNILKRDTKTKQVITTSINKILTNKSANTSFENQSRNKNNSMQLLTPDKVPQSNTITRSKSHDNICDLNANRERIHDSLSDMVSVHSRGSSRTSSGNFEERHQDAHSNTYGRDADKRHNRYEYKHTRRSRSKSPAESRRKYRESLNQRNPNMMTLKDDSADKRKLSKKQQKELYKRKLREEQNAKLKTKKKKLKNVNVNDTKEKGREKTESNEIKKRVTASTQRKKMVNFKMKEMEKRKAEQTKEVEGMQTDKEKNNGAAQKQKFEGVRRKIASNTQKQNIMNVQLKKAEQVTNLQNNDDSGGYTPPLYDFAADTLSRRDPETNINSTLSSAITISKIAAQSMSNVTETDDSNIVDVNSQSRVDVQQSLSAASVKTPAQKKEYSLNCSPTKLICLRKDMEVNITKLAQTVQSILNTNPMQQHHNVLPSSVTGIEHISMRSEVASDSISLNNVKSVKQKLKLTRPEMTQNINYNETDSVSVSNSTSVSNKPININNSNTPIETANVNTNATRKESEQTKLNTSKRSNENVLKNKEKETTNNDTEQTPIDVANIDIKGEPASSSSEDESYDSSDLDIKKELLSVNEATNELEKKKYDTKSDSGVPGTSIENTQFDNIIENKPEEHANNVEQTKKGNDINSPENTCTLQKIVIKPVESLATRTELSIDINKSKDTVKQKCIRNERKEVSKKYENKNRYSKDLQNKQTEKIDEPNDNKHNKNNKTGKSSNSRSNSEENINRNKNKSVNKEKSNERKQEEIKENRLREKGKESDTSSIIVCQNSEDCVNSTIESKSRTAKINKIKNNSELTQKKAKQSEELLKKLPTSKDKGTITTTIKAIIGNTPATKTKSTNTPYEKLDKHRNHKEVAKKEKVFERYKSRKEKDKSGSSRLSLASETFKEYGDASSVGNNSIPQPIEICITPDISYQSRDSILNRLISIDMTIQKLMHEKWNLYKKLQITDGQLPLLIPSTEMQSSKTCICTEPPRKQQLLQSEFSISEKITSTDTTSQAQLRVIQDSEKESEIPSKKRRLSIPLSESSISDVLREKTQHSEHSIKRQISGRSSETVLASDILPSRTETISSEYILQQQSVTPPEGSITNEMTPNQESTANSLTLLPRPLSATPSDSSIIIEQSSIRDESSISESLRMRQLSITPSESSITNETIQNLERTPTSDILRPSQLSITQSESNVTNENLRKRPLSLTPSESSLTEHAENIMNDNDPSDVDSEVQMNKTPKKKRLQTRVTTKRKKKKSLSDVEDVVDVLVEDDINNESTFESQKFRVKLPNMKTRNKNRKLTDLFVENYDTELKKSEVIIKRNENQQETNIRLVDSNVDVSNIHNNSDEAIKFEEKPCIKTRRKSKTNANNVEQHNLDPGQDLEAAKLDETPTVRTRGNNKSKKLFTLCSEIEVKEEEWKREIDCPSMKTRNKNKGKQDKSINLEITASQEMVNPETAMKQDEIMSKAVETRGRKTRASINAELNVEQKQKEDSMKKGETVKKEKIDETPVINTRNRNKSRTNLNLETDQNKNDKVTKSNDHTKEDIDKQPLKRRKTRSISSEKTSDITNPKHNDSDDFNEEDDIPLLERVTILVKDNEYELKPNKIKSRVAKNKNKLIEDQFDNSVKETILARETRSRSTSLSKETMDVMDKQKTMKVVKDSAKVNTSLPQETVIDVDNLKQKSPKTDRSENKLILPEIIPDTANSPSNVQTANSLSKDSSPHVSETEQVTAEQPRKIVRSKSKRNNGKKSKSEDVTQFETSTSELLENTIECVSPSNTVVTTPCFVHLERVNISAGKPIKQELIEVCSMPKLSPTTEIVEVQGSIQAEITAIETSDIVESHIVDSIIPEKQSTSKLIDEQNDSSKCNIVESTLPSKKDINTETPETCAEDIAKAPIEDNEQPVISKELQIIPVIDNEITLGNENIVGNIDLIDEDGVFCMGHQKSILDLKVIGDEFLAASEDGTIYKYCLKSGSLQDAYTGHKKAVTCMYLINGNILNIDSPLLYTGSLDCCLKCYNIDTAEIMHNVVVEQAIQCMDSAWGHIFLGTYDGLLFIYNIKKKLLHDQSLTIASATVLMIKATTEGSRQVLILASRKREIMVRDAFTGLLLRTMCQEQKPTIYSLYLDRSMVYCGTSDKGILILDFNNGNQISSYTAGKGVVCMLMYKTLLFAGCYDGMIYVYNTRTHKQVKALSGPGDGMLLSLAITNNIIIAGTKKDHLLKIWKIPQDILEETMI